LFPIDHGQEVLFQEPGEELLGQVWGLVGRVALAADEGVEGIPVGAAQGGQRLTGLRRGSVAGGDDQAPAGGGELAGGAGPEFGVGGGHARIVEPGGGGGAGKTVAVGFGTELTGPAFWPILFRSRSNSRRKLNPWRRPYS